MEFQRDPGQDSMIFEINESKWNLDGIIFWDDLIIQSKSDGILQHQRKKIVSKIPQ